MNEPRNDGPQWVPYQPPPPSGKERAWIFIRRLSFPLVLVLFLGGLGALLVLSPDSEAIPEAVRDWMGQEAPPTQPAARTSPSVDLDSLAAAEAEREAANGDDRLGSGYAYLSVFSEPSSATVLIDSDSIGVTPINRHALRSGVYIITVRKDNFFSADTVAILRNEQAPIYSVSLTPRSGAGGEALPALAEQRRLSGPPSQEAPPDTPPEAAASDDDAASAPNTSTNAGASSAADTTPDTASPPASPEPDTTPSTSIETASTTGTLRFTSEPADARVVLDGEVVGTTPLTLDAVEAGTYEVVITRQGYDTLRTDVTLAAEEERVVEAALNERMGRVRVLVQPWGSIYINGELHERNADVRYETALPAGEHEVAAVHPALGRQTRTVTVRAGEQVSLTIDLRESPPEEPGGVSSGGGAPTSSRAWH